MEGRAFMVARGVGSDRVFPRGEPGEQDATDVDGLGLRAMPGG